MSMLQFFKRSLFTLFFLAMALQMTAQDQQYFVYIQSERSQPFYVRYDGKLIPSSDKGYLILSKMPAGTASLRIGFAKSDVPERQYLVRVSGANDQGYLFKKDGDRGYALFNLQTYAVTRPSEDRKKEDVAVAEAPAEKPVAQEAPAVQVPDVAASVPDATGTPAPVATSGDTPLVPAPPVAVASDDTQKQAMMASLKKDLDSTFPTKEGVSVGPGTRPVKQTNKFSQALDKVVSDDRPDDIEEPQPKAPVAVTAPAGSSVAAPVVSEAPAETPKKKRRKREREPLTDEEKELASAIIAEENKAADAAPVDPVTITETPAPAVAAQPAVVSTEPVKEEGQSRKEKKQRKKKAEDPAFIDFGDTNGQQTAPSGTPAPAVMAETPVATLPVMVPEEEPVKAKKKKRNKLAEKIDTIDTAERPNNVVSDPTGYEVSDLSIDHSKERIRDRKRKKSDEEVVSEVAAPVTAPATESKSGLKMINSDCGKVMDDETFRKTLKKYAAAKDDDAMIASFGKQTKGYCLESSQIRTMVQLLSTDDSKYRLLDQAYPKAYHSDEFAGMESLLSDNYYKGRFRAMLHR